MEVVLSTFIDTDARLRTGYATAYGRKSRPQSPYHEHFMASILWPSLYGCLTAMEILTFLGWNRLIPAYLYHLKVFFSYQLKVTTDYRHSTVRGLSNCARAPLYGTVIVTIRASFIPRLPHSIG